MMIRTLLILLCMAAGVPATAQRVALPVRAVTLSDGAKRYAVTLRIGGREIEAGVDTGSTGLRVLARALPPEIVAARGPGTRYGYGSGARYEGEAIPVAVGVGDRADRAIRIQRIDKVGCDEGHPDCPAARVAPDRYGIQGDGLPGEGFAAILGIGFGEDVTPNPFAALGVRRWIVELPRPGDTAPGRIILDPTDDEVAGYRTVKVLAGMNAVAGCIAAPVGAKPICGPARLDSGAPGIRIVTAGGYAPLANGVPARLTIGDKAGAVSIGVTLGRIAEASAFRWERDPAAREPQLYFGIAPYLRWSVLYDFGVRTIGVKAR